MVADTTYGNSPELLNFIEDEKRYYVMEIPKTLHVSLSAEQKAQTVSAVASSLDPTRWTRLAFDFGEKGLIFYHWVTLRVTPTTDMVGEQWRLLRRSHEGEMT